MGSLAWLDAIRAASMDARPLEPPKKPAECHALDETMTIGPVVLHPIVVRQQMYIANGQTTTHATHRCSDQPQLYSLGQHHHNRPRDIQPPAFISLTWPRPSAAGVGGSLSLDACMLMLANVVRIFSCPPLTCVVGVVDHKALFSSPPKNFSSITSNL